MSINSKTVVRGLDYLYLALLAFGGLGLEVVLAFLIEPLIYGSEMNSWSTTESIIHWIITCILWCTVISLLIRSAKRKLDFDIFKKKSELKLWQWITVTACIVFMLVISYLDWNGFKIIKEFNSKGLLKFIFQYIYYFFETGLFTLIIVFGQKAAECWFHNKRIPYGGILVALTWGVAHIFTKSIETGILSALGGFIFGGVYLLVNRDIIKAFLILFIMFII